MRLNYIDNIDCLEGLKDIPDKSVDLVVTDPPYGIGIKSQGGKGSKLNPWADMCNASIWYSAWLRECKRIIKDDGAVWSFIKKPLDLIRWLIQISGKQGGVILDPFMGSGTTACAAVLEGCHYIGFEMDSNWKEKADARIADTIAQEPEEDWML